MLARTDSNLPRHVHFVGVLILVWAVLGLADFTLLNVGAEFYTSRFTPEQLEFHARTPAWVLSIWGASVLSACIGAALLLRRRAKAVTAFAATGVGAAVVALHNSAAAPAGRAFDPGVLLFLALLCGIVVYASWLKRRGSLR